MSRAFVKESDDGVDGELAERTVSPHRNLVTPEGLRQMEAQLRELDTRLSTARNADDKATMAVLQRDLRYWSQRRATAELVVAPTLPTKVRFGTTVTVAFDDDTQRDYMIVGEDEADPTVGKISYVSPVATLMIGAEVGDPVSIGQARGEIIAIR
jgi:transcription elongation GreA/GreB family factor